MLVALEVDLDVGLGQNRHYVAWCVLRLAGEESLRAHDLALIWPGLRMEILEVPRRRLWTIGMRHVIH